MIKLNLLAFNYIVIKLPSKWKFSLLTKPIQKVMFFNLRTYSIN